MTGDRVMMIEGKTPDVFSKKTDTGLEGLKLFWGTVWIANHLLPTPFFRFAYEGIRTMICPLICPPRLFPSPVPVKRAIEGPGKERSLEKRVHHRILRFGLAIDPSSERLNS